MRLTSKLRHPVFLGSQHSLGSKFVDLAEDASLHGFQCGLAVSVDVFDHVTELRLKPGDSHDVPDDSRIYEHLVELNVARLVCEIRDAVETHRCDGLRVDEITVTAEDWDRLQSCQLILIQSRRADGCLQACLLLTSEADLSEAVLRQVTRRFIADAHHRACPSPQR